MKLILVTDDPELQANQATIALLLRDALAEFQSLRGPTAAEYVARRYPEAEGYGWLDRPAKIRHVEARKRLAERLAGAELTIQTTAGETGHRYQDNGTLYCDICGASETDHRL